MPRNVDLLDPDISRTLVPKNLPNGRERFLPEIKKAVPFLENIIREKLELGKNVPCDTPKAVDCEEMPRLESSPLDDMDEEIPASPEMPTLVPFVFETEDARGGVEARMSINGYYRLNKENMNLSDRDSPRVKNRTDISASPLTLLASVNRRKHGRPKRKPKSSFSLESVLNDKRFQPVVLLRRLPDKSDQWDNDSREVSCDSWPQWPEVYEGCSYDDFVCDGDSVTIPEVDMIDGVEFLSFLQEGDVKEYAQKSNQSTAVPSDNDSESGSEGASNLKDDHALIFPTKTRDITQIKGWKRKIFFGDNSASVTPSNSSPNYLESYSSDLEDENGEEVQQPSSSASRPNSALSSSSLCSYHSEKLSGDELEVRTDREDDYDGAQSENETLADVAHRIKRNFHNVLQLRNTSPKSHEVSNRLSNEKGVDKRDFGNKTNNDVKDVTEQNKNQDMLNQKPRVEDNVLVLGEQPDSYGTAKTTAFASRSLDDFLDKHSTLEVDFLMKCNPVVNFIPSNHPILNVGCLTVEDKEKEKQSSNTTAPDYRRNSDEQKPKGRTYSSTRNFFNRRRATFTSKIKTDKKKPKKNQQHKVVENTIVLEKSKPTNQSTISSSKNSSTSPDSSFQEVVPLNYLENSNNKRDEYLENALIYESTGMHTCDLNFGNFPIENYNPITCDDEILSESRNQPLTIIQETVWSTTDTMREERRMHNFLCKLKCADQRPRIKFGLESSPERIEVLTEDDAQEVAKCVYMGYSSLQEMVKEVKDMEELKRSSLAKSAQLAGERKRKKEAQLKTIQGFVEWYRADSVNSAGDNSYAKRSRYGSCSSLELEDETVNIAGIKLRKTAKSSGFLASEPISDEDSNSAGQDEISSESSPPVLHPHSPAFPLHNNSESHKNLDSALVSFPVQPFSSLLDTSFTYSDRSLTPSPVTFEKSQEPSPRQCDTNELECLSDPEWLPLSHEDSRLFNTKQTELPVSSQVLTPSIDDAPESTEQQSNLNTSITPLPPLAYKNTALMVLNVSTPVCNDGLSQTGSLPQRNSHDESESLKSPTTAVETKIPDHDQTLNIDTNVHEVEGIATLYLVPLNEYQWKPPHATTDRSPTIKSFIISKPDTDLSVLLNQDTINIPLAAIAQPARVSKFPNANIYLLYGFLELPDLHSKGLEVDKTAKGLNIFVGKQKLFLSCSVPLVKAPIPVNAVIGKIITPLLLHAVVNGNTSLHNSEQLFAPVPGLLKQTLTITEPCDLLMHSTNVGSSIQSEIEPVQPISVTRKLNASNVDTLPVIKTVKSNTITVPVCSLEGSKNIKIRFPDTIMERAHTESVLRQLSTISEPQKTNFETVQVNPVSREQSSAVDEMHIAGQHTLSVVNTARTKLTTITAPIVVPPVDNFPNLSAKLADRKVPTQSKTPVKGTTQYLASPQRSPLTFTAALPVRPVQHVKPLQQATPLPPLEAKIITSGGPRKIVILQATKAGLLPGVIQTLISKPASQAVTPKVTTPASTPTKVTSSPKTFFTQRGVNSPKYQTEAVKTQVKGGGGGQQQYLLLQTPKGQQVIPLPSNLKPGESHTALLRPDGELRLMSPTTLGADDTAIRKIFSQQTDPNNPGDGTGNVCVTLHSTNVGSSKPEISITDVRTCSPALFENISGNPKEMVGSTEANEGKTSESVPDPKPDDGDDDSMWISSAGEPCFVMRLPDEDEEDNLSDAPQIISCS